MTTLPFAALAALTISSSTTAAVAAVVTYDATLTFLSESFDDAYVETLAGDIVTDGIRLPGTENVYGFTGRFSNLVPGDTVTLSFSYDDTDTLPPSLLRITSCSLGGVNCLDFSFPYARLPGTAGDFGIFKTDGLDIAIEGNLIPGRNVTFTEPHAGTRAPALGGDYRGFFVDYLAEFSVVASTFAPAEVPLPASAALLPMPFLLLWTLGRRRRVNS